MNLRDNNLIKLLSKLNSDQKEILAENIFQKLKLIHQEKTEQDWMDVFTLKLNLSRFNHGLVKNQGLRDYILTDYAREYLHIVKDRRSSRLIKNNSLLDVIIKDDLSVDFEIADEFGDKILDYSELDLIAFYDLDFANILIKKFAKERHEGRFYKILSLYSAKKLLDFIVSKESLEFSSQKKENDKIVDFIIDCYEDFAEYKPNWIR